MVVSYKVDRRQLLAKILSFMAQIQVHPGENENAVFNHNHSDLDLRFMTIVVLLVEFQALHYELSLHEWVDTEWADTEVKLPIFSTMR